MAERIDETEKQFIDRLSLGCGTITIGDLVRAESIIKTKEKHGPVFVPVETGSIRGRWLSEENDRLGQEAMIDGASRSIKPCFWKTWPAFMLYTVIMATIGLIVLSFVSGNS